MEGELLLRAWQLPDGEPEELGWVDPVALGARWSVFDPSGTTWIYGKDRTIYARPLPVGDGTYDRVVGTHDTDGVRPRFDVNGDLLVTADGEGELRVWSLTGPAGRPLRVIPRPEGAPASNRLALDPTARWVYWWSFDHVDRAQLWDLEALPGAQPLELRRSGSWEHSFFAFHPQGEWLAATTKDLTQLSLWPLRRPYPSVVKGTSSTARGLAFSPDGRWLATVWPPSPGHARLLPLPHTGPTAVPELAEHSLYSEPVFDAAGQRLSGGSESGDDLSIVPLDGSEPQRLEGFLSDTWVGAVAFSPSGRLLAAASRMSAEKMLRVWKVDTGEVTAFELPRTTETGADVGFEDNVQNLWFTDEETLYTVGPAWFLRWNLKDGSSEEVLPLDYQVRIAAASADGQRVLMIADEVEGFSTHVCATPQLWDLKAEAFEELPFLGSCVRKIALDPGGQVAVTGDGDGIIRVGRVSGGEPHLLVGHEGAIEAVAISPDLRWVASVGTDGTLRLWPMPELDKPPLHTLPHDDLIAKLHTLTNLRAVRDETSATGWTIEVGPFPGWKNVPEW
jgi:WD40 repeat protein